MKRTMKKVRISPMLIMLLFLSATGIQAQTIVPSKKYVTKQVENISEFHTIRVLGSPEVEYRQSKDAQTTVSIYASDNLVDLVEASTVNGVLQVKLKEGVQIQGGERRLIVKASSPSLKQVDLQGSGDVSLKGTIKGDSLQLNLTTSGDIDAEDLQFTNLLATLQGSGDIDVQKVKGRIVNIQVIGSGDVKVRGNVLLATLNVKGSGDIDAVALTANKVNASVSGSGDIECHALLQLDAEVQGSGDIEYWGQPNIINKRGKKEQILGG